GAGGNEIACRAERTGCGADANDLLPCSVEAEDRTARTERGALSPQEGEQRLDVARVTHLGHAGKKEDPVFAHLQRRLALVQEAFVGFLEGDSLVAPEIEGDNLSRLEQFPAPAGEVAVIDPGCLAQMLGQLRMKLGAVCGEEIVGMRGAFR